VLTQSWKSKSVVPVFHMYCPLMFNGYSNSKWCYTPLQHDYALDPIIPPLGIRQNGLGNMVFGYIVSGIRQSGTNSKKIYLC
jgi:hypothetical protein